MSFTASVISAKEWGAKPPKQWPDTTRPRYIIIHHTATPNAPNDLSKGTLWGSRSLARSIQKSHMDGFGWDDSGHNFLNTTGGYLLEGRQGSLSAIKKGGSVSSAHAGSTLGNQSPGIENEGTFISYRMNAKQWKSLVDLCVSICNTTKISPDNIKGHRDFSPTQCPGDWLYSQLPRLRREVRQRLDSSVEDYLREGDTGLKVKDLQQSLQTQGFSPGPVDGIFGPATTKAVISFQKFEGINPNGLVGSKTWEALKTSSKPSEKSPSEPGNKKREPVVILNTYKYYRGLPHQKQAIEWLQKQLPKEVLEEFSERWRNDQPSSAYLPLIEGAVGSEVEELQERLQTQGFYSGATDGDFGSRTKSSVIAYQKAKGLYADGIVGSITWSTLNLD